MSEKILRYGTAQLVEIQGSDEDEDIDDLCSDDAICETAFGAPPGATYLEITESATGKKYYSTDRDTIYQYPFWDALFEDFWKVAFEACDVLPLAFRICPHEAILKSDGHVIPCGDKACALCERFTLLAQKTSFPSTDFDSEAENKTTVTYSDNEWEESVILYDEEISDAGKENNEDATFVSCSSANEGERQSLEPKVELPATIEISLADDPPQPRPRSIFFLADQKDADRSCVESNVSSSNTIAPNMFIAEGDGDERFNNCHTIDDTRQSLEQEVTETSTIQTQSTDEPPKPRPRTIFFPVDQRDEDGSCIEATISVLDTDDCARKDALDGLHMPSAIEEDAMNVVVEPADDEQSRAAQQDDSVALEAALLSSDEVEIKTYYNYPYTTSAVYIGEFEDSGITINNTAYFRRGGLLAVDQDRFKDFEQCFFEMEVSSMGKLCVDSVNVLGRLSTTKLMNENPQPVMISGTALCAYSSPGIPFVKHIWVWNEFVGFKRLAVTLDEKNHKSSVIFQNVYSLKKVCFQAVMVHGYGGRVHWNIEIFSVYPRAQNSPIKGVYRVNDLLFHRHDKEQGHDVVLFRSLHCPKFVVETHNEDVIMDGSKPGDICSALVAPEFRNDGLLRIWRTLIIGETGLFDLEERTKEFPLVDPRHFMPFR